MPADAWALPFAIGARAHSGAKSEKLESGNQDPARGRMAGQERRIDDTMLIREAQRGNRAAFEELVRHYDQAVLRLAFHLTGTEHDAQDVIEDEPSRPGEKVRRLRVTVCFQRLPRGGQSVHELHT